IHRLLSRKRGNTAQSKGFHSRCAGLLAKRLECDVFRRFLTEGQLARELSRTQNRRNTSHSKRFASSPDVLLLRCPFHFELEDFPDWNLRPKLFLAWTGAASVSFGCFDEKRRAINPAVKFDAHFAVSAAWKMTFVEIDHAFH